MFSKNFWFLVFFLSCRQNRQRWPSASCCFLTFSHFNFTHLRCWTAFDADQYRWLLKHTCRNTAFTCCISSSCLWYLQIKTLIWSSTDHLMVCFVTSPVLSRRIHPHVFVFVPFSFLCTPVSHLLISPCVFTSVEPLCFCCSLACIPPVSSWFVLLFTAWIWLLDHSCFQQISPFAAQPDWRCVGRWVLIFLPYWPLLDRKDGTFAAR